MPSFQTSTVLALLSSALVASAVVLPNSASSNGLLRRQTNTIAGLTIPSLCQAGCDSSLPIYASCTSGDQTGCLTVCESGRQDALISCANCIYLNIDRSLLTEQSHETVEDQLDNIDDICDALNTNDNDDDNVNVDFIDYEDVGRNYTSSSTTMASTTAQIASSTTTSAPAAVTSASTDDDDNDDNNDDDDDNAATTAPATGAGSRTTNTVGGAITFVSLVSAVALFV
ncbi:hypothetical protein BDY24DRAFT_368739 [Mrakia frigida]|uniref:uncharacterized protein n=1 Tax=Mrakia frigida TaxID=29902 RepID=UPI003FCC22B2